MFTPRTMGTFSDARLSMDALKVVESVMVMPPVEVGMPSCVPREKPPRIWMPTLTGMFFAVPRMAPFTVESA